MITLAVVLLVCGTVCLIGYRAEGVLSTKWQHDRRHADARAFDADRLALRAAELEARRVAVEERRIALAEREAARLSTPPNQPTPMPDDLARRITVWDEEFAQESERQTIMGLFAALGDWDLVRQKLAPLAPVLSTEIAAPRDGMIQ